MSCCLFWYYRPPCQLVIQSGSFFYSFQVRLSHSSPQEARSTQSIFRQTAALSLISILSVKFLNVYSSIVFNHPSFPHQTSTNRKMLISLIILQKLVFLQPSTTFLPPLTPEIPLSSPLSTSVLIFTALIKPSFSVDLRPVSVSTD